MTLPFQFFKKSHVGHGKLEEYKANTEKWKPLNCQWVPLVDNTIKILGIHCICNKYFSDKKAFVWLMVGRRTLLNI